MIHDVQVCVVDVHHAPDGEIRTIYTETIPNAIDLLDAYFDAMRNVSLIYTYDINYGYYVDSLRISKAKTYLKCVSYADQNDYHILSVQPESQVFL